MKMIGNIILSLTSLVVMIFLGEFAFRTVLEPVDYLLPTLVEDPYLNHRIEGGTGGHDEWGFRNFDRPAQADIVAIGDSMTYGISARAQESWPFVLSTIGNRTVYNMALGGYGPVHYLHLLKTRAMTLNPKTIIIGLYFGNDFIDSYNLVHSNSNWAKYGNASQDDSIDPNAFIQKPGRKRVFGDLRSWLSRNSVLYVAIKQNTVFDFVRQKEFEQKNTNFIVFKQGDRQNLFAPNRNFSYVNLKDPRYPQSLEIIKKAFMDMQQIASDGKIRMVVVLIPTKESAYARLFAKTGFAESNERLKQVIDDEEISRNQISQYFQANDMEYLDLLPALQKANAEIDIYPQTDGHPNWKGYEIIAREIDSYLTKPTSH